MGKKSNQESVLPSKAVRILTLISIVYDVSNNGFRPGVHMDYGRNEKIDNVFETEEYMDALKRIRKWYLKGYLRKDIFGETEPALKRVKQGKVFAYTTKGKPGIESQDKTGGKND